MKHIPILLIFITLAVGVFWVHTEVSSLNKDVSIFQESSLSQDQSTHDELLRFNKSNQKKEEEVQIYTILAAGDIMLDRGVESRVKQTEEGYDFPFNQIRNVLSEADFAFANLEGSISSVGADTGKKFSFRFEPATALAIKDSGIDIVSLANNHMLDWGRESLCETTRYLDQVQVLHVGAGCDTSVAEAPAIVELGNTKVAFLAYTEFYKGAHATSDRAGMSEFNLDKITDRIQKLKSEGGVDVVMVSMHWGEEYKPRANDFQVTTGQMLIDAGADVIIGHHPHVDQQIERYNNGWIVYSLGNFIFDQSFSEETMESILAEITIQNKAVLGVKALPIKINSDFQPSLIQ